MIITFIHGLLMAFADSVPGVSGGTIAFLLGFYDKFIGSINDFIRGKKKERIEALKYLIKLGIGWIIGMGLAVTILASVFEKHIYSVSSLFLGFIIAAIPVVIYEERETLKRLRNLCFIIPGAAVVVALAILGTTNGFQADGISVGKCIYAIVAGMCAISAMVLPGISGSTVLLTFGIYIPLIQDVKNLMHMDFSGIWLVICIAVGVLLGVVISVGIIKKSLDRFRGQTIYTVIGMMIGSLYAIVQGPTTLEGEYEALGFSNFGYLWFVVGVVIVLGMKGFHILKSRKTK